MRSRLLLISLLLEDSKWIENVRQEHIHVKKLFTVLSLSFLLEVFSIPDNVKSEHTRLVPQNVIILLVLEFT